MEKLISILAVLVAIVAVGLAIFAVQSVDNISVPSADEIAAKVNVTVIQEVVNNSDLEEFLADELKDKREAESQNETAKELVLAEKSKKAFLLDLLDVLEAEGKSIESYKDLDIYSFVIKESEVSGDEAEVEVILKVSGVEDGDDESEFRARLKAIFIVEDLVFDDDFEDAEVTLDSLVLEKFYD